MFFYANCNCVKERNRIFALPKTTNSFEIAFKMERSKMDRNAPITIPELDLWDWSLIVSKDTEMKARIRGVQSMMTTFNFYFGCTLGEQLLRQTDNLSRALQDSSTSAAQGNRLVRMS